MFMCSSIGKSDRQGQVLLFISLFLGTGLLDLVWMCEGAWRLKPRL